MKLIYYNTAKLTGHNIKPSTSEGYEYVLSYVIYKECKGYDYVTREYMKHRCNRGNNLMIYVTGDTHGALDIDKLNEVNFVEQKNMTKSDFLIICGDFGSVFSDREEELNRRKYLNQKNFTTLFVDGNHENFSSLYNFPVKECHGGKVHFVEDIVIHIMRGQIYDLDGFSFFTMGGGTSTDKKYRKEWITWWKGEIPSYEEFSEAITNLENYKWKVDYVLSHTTSLKNMIEMCYVKENSELKVFFDMLEKDLVFKHWFFGHFHDDYEFRDKKHTLVYDEIIKLL